MLLLRRLFAPTITRPSLSQNPTPSITHPTLRRQSMMSSPSSSPDACLHLLPASSTSSLPEALSTLHAASRPTHKAGETRLFYVDGKIHATVALGKGADEDEAVRVAVGKGVKALREGGANGVVEIAGLEGKKAHAAGESPSPYRGA